MPAAPPLQDTFTTHLADLKIQVLQVPVLLFGDAQESGVLIRNSSGVVLVFLEGICGEVISVLVRGAATTKTIPEAIRMRVVPVSRMPDVVRRTSPVLPYLID